MTIPTPVTEFSFDNDLDGSFADQLAEHFLPDIPEEICAAVFSKAWEDGHASGTAEVVMHYEELADLIVKTFRAGLEYESEIHDPLCKFGVKHDGECVVKCERCDDEVVRHPGNGGQWLGAHPPRDYGNCYGAASGPKHFVSGGATGKSPCGITCGTTGCEGWCV